jgi:hypothetical protein
LRPYSFWDSLNDVQGLAPIVYAGTAFAYCNYDAVTVSNEKPDEDIRYGIVKFRIRGANTLGE